MWVGCRIISTHSLARVDRLQHRPSTSGTDQGGCVDALSSSGTFPERGRMGTMVAEHSSRVGRMRCTVGWVEAGLPL